MRFSTTGAGWAKVGRRSDGSISRRSHLPTHTVVSMAPFGRQTVAVACLSAALGTWFVAATVRGQMASSRFELSASISLNEVDGAVRSHLERVKAFLADGQWDEAVETLRQLMQNSGDRLIEFRDRRYITLREYCHAILASLPPEALALYRSRVDPQARKWYEEGLAKRDESLLKRLVEQHLVSSWGDDALLALGALSLEQGRHAEARSWWEKLAEFPPLQVSGDVFEKVRSGLEEGSDEARLLDHWYEAVITSRGTVYSIKYQQLPDLSVAEGAALVRFWRRAQLAPWQLTYPETSIPPADIQARLVLASILEGSTQRAERALDELRRLFPGASGRLCGRQGPLADTLAALLAESREWPQASGSVDWPTFAGSPSRNTVPTADIDVGAVKWRLPLEKVTISDATTAVNIGARPRRVAEGNNVLLSHHPIAAGGRVFYSAQHQIFAVDERTGLPVWPAGDVPTGEIYVNKLELSDRSHIRYQPLGVPRFTMTVQGSRLLARMGSSITGTMPDSSPRGSSGYIVCLDLSAQGRLRWKADPEDDKWAFEGSPLSDGQQVYVAMRRSDVRPQAHVACFDAETGRMRWRRYVCAAETPAHGMADECTHNLLTLHHDTLYFNTNLGAVAALDAADGRVKWLYAYPRVESGDLNRPGGNLYRDLTPCIYDRGRLFVAPADSERIICLDAQSGAFYWDTLLWGRGQYSPEDAIHLLGVGQGYLVASGDRLWRIHVETGRRQNPWPEGPTPRGFGRGVLVGDKIYWPTMEQIFVLSQKTGLPVQQPIDLRQRGVTGGNLIVANGNLFVASPSELVALDRYSQVDPAEPNAPRTQAKLPLRLPSSADGKLTADANSP